MFNVNWFTNASKNREQSTVSIGFRMTPTSKSFPRITIPTLHYNYFWSQKWNQWNFKPCHLWSKRFHRVLISALKAEINSSRQSSVFSINFNIVGMRHHRLIIIVPFFYPMRVESTNEIEDFVLLFSMKFAIVAIICEIKIARQICTYVSIF